MPDFYFPIIWLFPEFEEDVCKGEFISVYKRKWEVSIFDLYSMVAAKHPLQLHAELLEIFLRQVNLEVMVNRDDFDQAADVVDCFRAMIYLRHVMQTTAPFASNFSVNQYAGINDRSSGRLDIMHEGLREGITHATSRIQIWTNELSFNCIQSGQDDVSRDLGAGIILAADRDLEAWIQIEKKSPEVRAARRALVKSPLMPDLQSSILQIWQGLEGLFPSISTEITFRTSLFLAELLHPLHPKIQTYEKAKKSYADRSKIAHGSQKPVNKIQWFRAWSLLRDTLQAILMRKALPTEEELTKDLLEGGGLSIEDQYT